MSMRWSGVFFCSIAEWIHQNITLTVFAFEEAPQFFNFGHAFSASPPNHRNLLHNFATPLNFREYHFQMNNWSSDECNDSDVTSKSHSHIFLLTEILNLSVTFQRHVTEAGNSIKNDDERKKVKITISRELFTIMPQPILINNKIAFANCVEVCDVSLSLKWANRPESKSEFRIEKKRQRIVILFQICWWQYTKASPVDVHR